MVIDSFPEYIRIAVDAENPKRRENPPAFSPNRAPLRWILFLERTGGPAVIERVGCAETVARLTHSLSPYLMESERTAAIDRLEQMACVAKRYKIKGWGNPEERLSAVDSLLMEEEGK
jgi:hypothetical protein